MDAVKRAWYQEDTMITHRTVGMRSKALAALMLLVGLVSGASVAAQDRMSPIPPTR